MKQTAKSSGRVMAFGTFDLVHLGHLAYLQQAKKLGKELVVVVTHDNWVKREKGHLPLFSGRERLRLVRALKPVDRAVLGSPGDKLAVVRKEHPAVLCLGYDQRKGIRAIRAQLVGAGLFPRIVRATPYAPHVYKGHAVRKKIHHSYRNH